MMAQASDGNPVVSVVIPTNNRKKWVCEALASVFNQSYTNYEVIVVDDGSDDGTSEHLSLIFGDKIHLFRINGGNSSISRNFGASKAVGKYLAFLDDDDRWYPNKLQRQVDYLEASAENVAMVGSACDYMDAKGNPTWKPSFPDDELTYEVACVKPKLPGAISGCLIKKSVYDELGGMNAKNKRNDDRELWIRMTRSYRVPMMQEVLSTVRLHDTKRRGVDTDVIERCRLDIDSRIPEPDLRRKARAWTYFHLFNLNWKERKFKALKFLFKSFASYPAALPIPSSRVKIMLKNFMGRS